MPMVIRLIIIQMIMRIQRIGGCSDFIAVIPSTECTSSWLSAIVNLD